jgi:hypothetical protein
MRRLAMTRMLDITRPPGQCGGSCARVFARPVTDAPSSGGPRTEVGETTSEATLNRNDASLVKMYEIGRLKTLSLYRERVDLEIARASEDGARWWSRRLVEWCEESGLVFLDR